MGMYYRQYGNYNDISLQLVLFRRPVAPVSEREIQRVHRPTLKRPARV
jgi:hypothetical protein